jgi:integrase
MTTSTLTIRQQLARGTTTKPVFVSLKNKKPRVIDLGPETLALLRKHHAHQAELKMANRTTYHDHGLIFAKEWEDLQRQRYALGDPLLMTNIGQREFVRLTKTAGVRPITFHGLRHTSATLLLKAGVPPKVVQERLGHRSIGITRDVYAHVLPGMQQEAAAKLGALLHG